MAALAPGLVNLVLNSTKVENFAVASNSFTMVAAFLVIITALCGVVSHWCLGADLAWLSQLSQQSLPALRSKPPKDLILPTDQDISMYALILSQHGHASNNLTKLYHICNTHKRPSWLQVLQAHW